MERIGSTLTNRLVLRTVQPCSICIVPYRDIIRIEAAQDYVHFYTSTEYKAKIPYLRSHTSMRKTLEKLPIKFIRPHVSHVVNIDHIRSFTVHDIEMSDGSIVPIGNNFGTNFRKIISELYPVFNKAKGPV